MSRNLLQRGVILLAILCLADCVEARVRRTCKVSYRTESGSFREYTMEVEFTTGGELNAATGRREFDNGANYVSLWFGPGEVAIARLGRSPLRRVGGEFDNDDFRDLFALLSDVDADQVNGNGSRMWRIAAKEFLRFIDPRAEERLVIPAP